MFHIVEVEDVVGIPPSMLGSDLNMVLKDILNEDKIGKIDKEVGVVLGVVKINNTGSAKVIPGDSFAYVDVAYSLLSFKPDLQNVYEGQIKEVAEFGAFMGLGPFDALIHVSQLMNDFVSFDPKNKHFVGKESNNILAKGDSVFSRVVTVSYKGNSVQSKIGLTMRQGGLGKLEWFEPAIAKGASAKTIEKKQGLHSSSLNKEETRNEKKKLEEVKEKKVKEKKVKK